MSYRRLKLVAASLALAVTLVPATADAQYYGGGRGGYAARNNYQRGDYYADNGYYARPGRRYARPAPVYDGPPPGYYREDYRGRRVQRRCDRGTGGTIIGAIAGGLLGDAAAGRGDRGAGAIVGAGVGALAGRAIDRNC